MVRKLHYNSPVILSYTFLSLLILLLGFATDNATTRVLFSVYASPLNDPLFYFRLFGHVFGHASVEHYFNNFLIILLIGPALEERYGSRQLVIAMVATALITGILNVIFFSTALLGASGIVFMFVILSSFVSLQRGRIPMTFIMVVFIFLGQEIVAGLFTTSNISHITHIAGGICGALMGFFINFPLGEK